MKDKIGQEIMEAHSRVAEIYAGGIFKESNPNSYENWSVNKIVTIITYILASRCNRYNIILDSGCGNGQFTKIFLKNSNAKKVIGVDFSENMLKVAKERAGINNYQDKMDLVRANLENIGLSEGTVDVVYLFGVIEHLENPQKVIEELVRVCKVNGIIILNIPRKYSLSHITFMTFGQNPRDWGTKNKSFKIWEKARYYRFYTFRDINNIICNYKNCQLLERIPGTYIWTVGLASLPFRILAKAGCLGILNKLDKLSKYIYPIPAGEFLVIKKIGI